jgi:hypothetical protein
MRIQKRSLTMLMLLAVASVFYGAARHYSPLMVEYVVEQTLIQKAPSGTNPESLNSRFHRHLSAAPNSQAKRMERLLRIAERLEKVQSLTPGELDNLLGSGTGEFPVLTN